MARQSRWFGPPRPQTLPNEGGVQRLASAQQPGATKPTFADVTAYKATSPLLISGLLGPVHVYSEAVE